MKKLGLIVLLVILIGTSFVVAADKPIIPKPSEIVCTCGCGQKAVQCENTCPVARELLKKYKEA